MPVGPQIARLSCASIHSPLSSVSNSRRSSPRGLRYAIDNGDDFLPMRLKLWLQKAFGLAKDIRHLAPSTIAARRRALDRTLGEILAVSTSCEFAMVIQKKFARASHQLLTFAHWPGQVEPTNNACERSLRPAVIQRKVTNGYRAMWAAEGEADVRTVVDTARLIPGANIFGAISATLGAA